MAVSYCRRVDKKIVHGGCYDIGKKGKDRMMRQIDGK
jgi:hypothetical protein